MKIKRLSLVFCLAVLAFIIAVLFLHHTNNLGLTGFDLLMGRTLDMQIIRANSKAVADSYLGRWKTKLVGENLKNSELVLDYSKSSLIRSLGYRSSFYYYCWDIYLPYSLRTNGVDIGTVIVQLSDGVYDHRHDVKEFRVLRTIPLDSQGRVSETIDQP